MELLPLEIMRPWDGKMKYFFIVFIFLTSPLYAYDVVIFSTTTNYVLNYYKSVPDEYTGRSDVLINPDLSSVEGVPIRYWIQDTGSIREMLQAEKDTVDADIASQIDTTLRTNAKAEFDGQTTRGQSLRCLSDIIKKEINLLRQWNDDFKAETSSSTSLGNFQTRVATLPDMPDRTLAQLKNQIQSCIDDGDVDE